MHTGLNGPAFWGGGKGLRNKEDELLIAVALECHALVKPVVPRLENPSGRVWHGLIQTSWGVHERWSLKEPWDKNTPDFVQVDLHVQRKLLAPVRALVMVALGMALMMAVVLRHRKSLGFHGETC
jgi:hypothetical protein